MLASFDLPTFPVLKTERLLLRALTPRDAAAVFAIRGDPEVARHNIGAPYIDLMEARRMISAARRQFRAQTEIHWGLALRDAPQSLIGLCCFNVLDPIDRRGSLGYDLNRAFWGHGLMREAVRAVIDFGFEQLDLHRIEAEIGAPNERSYRLLRALDFQQEGLQKDRYFEYGAFHDLALFGLLRPDWAQARSSG